MEWTGKNDQKNAQDRRRDHFLSEWYATLQELRQIGELVSRPENRPVWVNSNAVMGAQADQFLQAYYYHRTFDGKKANYAALFEQNKMNSTAALEKELDWWRNLPNAPSQPPSNEEMMLDFKAPFLKAVMEEDKLSKMTYESFHQTCSYVHSIVDYSRRVPNIVVGLQERPTPYTIPDKIAALSKTIWTSQSKSGHGVLELLKFLLYGGSVDKLPDRLWQAVTDPKWKLQSLGISALGELAGWALPDKFPPRNGRTSKALRALGYDVTIHVE